ncbi:hypothetical protein BCR44DRAFT_38985 [Catenaria anguillulae PL171]|uniref:Uncharacterized protein n=1 Tax=Catenaria anguillulae PL171 TaxID=765915 RepID=A0A1Y2HC73_9FUNG|nr:hypothetical protein BCR44DRAFT_38985 [Catenaria anguillulae PL171]
MPLDNVVEDEAPDGDGHVLLVAGKVLVLEFHFFDKQGGETIKAVKFDPAGDPFDAATRAQVETMLLRLLKAGMTEAAVRVVEELLRADHTVSNVAQAPSPSSDDAGALGSKVYRSLVAAWSDMAAGLDASMPVEIHERKIGATVAYFTTPGWQGGVVPAPGPSPGVYTFRLVLGEGGQAQVLANPLSSWGLESELVTVSNMHWSVVLEPPLPVCSATLDAIQASGVQGHYVLQTHF